MEFEFASFLAIAVIPDRKPLHETTEDFFEFHKKRQKGAQHVVSAVVVN